MAAITSNGSISGFEQRRLPGHGIEIDALVGGSGPPLLLLHGYPMTRVTWRPVAPALSEHYTVVIPDLRGYGRSDKPEGDARHELYSKRTMALDQLATMRALGFERFAVAGHDRGARVAYRLALDHPDAVASIVILDIVPTAEVWRAANASAAMRAFNLYLLAQRRPLPETLIGASPEFYVRHLLADWAAPGFAFDPANMADYIECFSDPSSIHGACEDYRAGWTRDREMDEADRGKRKIRAPLLVLWGKEYSVAEAQPLATWREWADEVCGRELPGGHFQSEEAPAETIRAVLDFLSATRLRGADRSTASW
jgi:haloacetate dehalogenase